MIMSGRLQLPSAVLTFRLVLRCKFTAFRINNKKKTLNLVKGIIFVAKKIVCAVPHIIYIRVREGRWKMPALNWRLKVTTFLSELYTESSFFFQ